MHEIEIFDELDGGDTNMIILNGYLCKKPTYRKTPYGREISDLFIAVYRHTGKSDYIPFAIAAESTTRLIMIITITARIAVRN